MAELYVGTPNGVQKLGNECTYPIPKGKVLLNSGILGGSTYESNSIDTLKNKTFIDVNFSNITDNDSSYSSTIRVFANSCNSCTINNNNASVKYDAINGIVFGHTPGNINMCFKATAYYYE